jgi:hypothetical protein
MGYSMAEWDLVMTDSSAWDGCRVGGAGRRQGSVLCCLLGAASRPAWRQPGAAAKGRHSRFR